MIDQKSQPAMAHDGPARMVDSTMTMSSSFTHLSMDTDEFSMSGEEHATNNITPNQSTTTASYSFVMYDALVDICQNNVKYFECDDSEAGQRFLCAFRGIIDHIAVSACNYSNLTTDKYGKNQCIFLFLSFSFGQVARQFVAKIITFVHEYDFDENTPYNGYRSFVKAIQACINHSVKVSKYIAQNRSYLLFRKNMYMK